MTASTPGAALHAAGALVRATDLVMRGEVDRAFCNVRPPGHHATRDRAMGFCFFNNVAVGVAHALQTYSVSRVAILDFDVHDCNGTIDIFKDDTRVLICSSFEHPLFPYTGTNSLSERIVRVPLEPYSTGAVFREAIAQRWIPCVEAFQPELIFVSAGFDGHVEDDMSDLALVDDDYRWITELIVELAERFAQGRIISTLEGGYNLDSLARAATVHVRALMGQ